VRQLVQLVLQALLPLLTRRVLAAERQAEAAERTYDLLKTYLCLNDPQFVDSLAGRLPDAEALAAPPDVQFDEGHTRDLRTMRMEALREMATERFGAEPSDEQLVLLYEQLYERAGDAGNPDVPGPGVAH